MKIWARILQDAKVVKDTIYTLPFRYDPRDLHEYLMDICENLHIPTPLVLNKHIYSLCEFSMVKFIPSEFVEPFPYDRLVLEIFE